MPSIQTFAAQTASEPFCQALAVDGAVVLRGVTDANQRSRLMAELAPFVARAEVASEVSDEDFYPGQTRRITALAKRSQQFQSLMLAPAITAACDHFLLPNCERYQLHVGSGLIVGPGARVQVLHREDDSYPFFTVPRPHLVVASMWAMTDFTRENGATNIVPGSHLWPADRTPTDDEIVPAEMQAGDMLIWLGGTLHGAGANTSDDWRYGVFMSFSLGWLRQEENQYLDAPWHVAKDLPKAVRNLLGYPMHNGLGFFDPTPD